MHDLTHLDVPRDYANNLAWRIAIREWAMDDTERQQALCYWCSKDFRLFLNGELLEPRDVGGEHSPQITPVLVLYVDLRWQVIAILRIPCWPLLGMHNALT